MPYVGIFLRGDISPMEAWMRLHGEVVESGLEADCWPLIDWIHVALTQKSGEDQPLTMLVSMMVVMLMKRDPLCHQHQVLIRYLLGLDLRSPTCKGS